MLEAKVACILITRISTFLPCNFSCCPIFSGYEPAVITRCNPAHGGVRKAKVACILFTRISTTCETSVTFLPVNFISSCPVLSGYESAVITQCNHKVYARRNLPVFLLQESVSCPVLSGDKSTVITRCKQGESCLYSFYKTQYFFARNFSSCPVLSGYKYAVITRGTQCESCLCILFPRINFYQEF